ncbi:MAG: hypothetical protein KDC92_17095, partial [Bacteroidetes bacterium]|nr:hypothetical protein [Bacteroidota bacterium]
GITNVNGIIDWVNENESADNETEVNLELSGMRKTLTGTEVSSVWSSKGKVIKSASFTYFIKDGKNYQIREIDSMGVKWTDTVEYRLSDLQKKTQMERETVAQVAEQIGIKSSKLGWINCDRFNSDPGPKTTIYAEVEDGKSPNVTLAFTRINSLMMGHYINENTVVFSGIPVGTKVTLIGVEADPKSKEVEIGKLTLKPKRTNEPFVLKLSPIEEEKIDQQLAGM